MILAADDLVDWVADRQPLLIAAWAPQIATDLAWERPFAEALSSEFHNAMVMTLLKRGTEKDFRFIVARSNTGLEKGAERTVADRFYNVTLKLARAASRHLRDNASTIMVFKYGMVVGDGRTDPSHMPLGQVLLPRHHSFWMRWQPPFGMDCRCGTNLMTQRAFESSGRAVTTESELAWIETQLQDCWPDEFRPLLDFREPLQPVVESEPKVRLTAEQLAGILAGFK